MLSKQLRIAIKMSRSRQYELAHAIGVHPGTLSAWVNGIYQVRLGDPRIIRLAALLNVPETKAFSSKEDDVVRG